MNAVPRLSLLGLGEVEQLHENTLRVLAEVGVRFESPSARAILKEGGAFVDDETRIARIPHDVVDWAVATAPKTILLSARDGQSDCQLDHTRSFVTLGGVAPSTLDFRTGERRQATTQDLADALLTADALPEIDFQWPVVIGTDEKPKLQGLRGVATMFANSGKHVQGELVDPKDVPYALEIVRSAAADGTFDPERPIFEPVLSSFTAATRSRPP